MLHLSATLIGLTFSQSNECGTQMNHVCHFHQRPVLIVASVNDATVTYSCLPIDPTGSEYGVPHESFQVEESEELNKSVLIRSSNAGKEIGQGRVVREANIKDLAVASTTLARAFVNDPFRNYVMPNVQDAEKTHILFQSRMITFGFQHGRVYGCYRPENREIIGVAVWQSPATKCINTHRVRS